MKEKNFHYFLKKDFFKDYFIMQRVIYDCFHFYFLDFGFGIFILLSFLKAFKSYFYYCYCYSQNYYFSYLSYY